MRTTAFHPEDIPPGGRATMELVVAPPANGESVRLPLLVARGAATGPTIVVLGGVHGNEYEGIVAVRDVFRSLSPMDMSGTFLGVPICNPPAFAAAARTSPIDGRNLARVFPGRPDGAISERIAHILTTSVIAHADFLIDLHSSGGNFAMPLLVGYYHGADEAARRSREAALRFGAPIVWGHGEVGPGRSLSEPHERGVPWLYTECPSGGWLHADFAARYADGVRNVMRFLGMLSGEALVAPIERELFGEGDTDRSLAAPASGFLAPRVELLDNVAAGDILGAIEDPFGDSIAEIRAQVDGVVIVRRNSPPVSAGDLTFLLT